MRTVTEPKLTLPAALLAAAFVLTSCSSDSSGPAVGDLSTVVIEAPAGYAELDGFGEFDLDGYVENYGDEDDRAILVKNEFTRGYARVFADEPGETVVGVFVYETKDGGAAKQLLKDFLDDARRNDGGVGFDVDGIKGAKGQSTIVSTEGDPERGHLVAFVRGKRLYVVGAQHSDLTTTTSAVVEVAKAEAGVAK